MVRCNRRRIENKPTTSKHRDATGNVINEYKSQLKCSRVMQVFKSSCLRSELRRDPESSQYLTRRDHMLKDTGFATGKRKVVESRLAHLDDENRSIRRRLESKCEPCEGD